MDRTLNNLEDEVQVTSIDDVILDSDDNANNNPIYECLSPGTRKAIIKEHDEIVSYVSHYILGRISIEDISKPPVF